MMIIEYKLQQIEDIRYNKKNNIQQMPKRLKKRFAARALNQKIEHDNNENQHETTVTPLANQNSNINRNHEGEHQKAHHIQNDKKCNGDAKKIVKEIKRNQGDKENCNEGVIVIEDRHGSKKKSSQSSKDQQLVAKVQNSTNNGLIKPHQQQQNASQQDKKQSQEQLQKYKSAKVPLNKQQKLTKKDIYLAIQQQHHEAKKIKHTKLTKQAQIISQGKCDPVQENGNNLDNVNDEFCNTGDQFIKHVQKWQKDGCGQMDDGTEDVIKKQQVKQVKKQVNKIKVQRSCYINKFYNQFYNFIVNKKPSQKTQTDSKTTGTKSKKVKILKSVLFYTLMPTILIPFLFLYTFYIFLYFITIWILIMPASAAGIETVKMYFKCKRQKQTYFTIIAGLIIKFGPVIFAVLWFCRIIRLFHRQAFRYDMRLVLSGQMTHILRCKPLNGTNKETQDQYELEEDENKCNCVCICQNCELCTEARKNYGQRCFPLHSKRILCIYFPESVENIFLRKLTEREEAAKQKQEQQEGNKPTNQTDDKKIGSKCVTKVAA